MTIIELAERLVNGLKEDEQTNGYRIVRAQFECFADVLLWLRDWTPDDGGKCPWFTGEGLRRETACRFLFARWLLARSLMTDHPRPDPISPTWVGLGEDDVDPAPAGAP